MIYIIRFFSHNINIILICTNNSVSSPNPAILQASTVLKYNGSVIDILSMEPTFSLYSYL